MNVRNDEVQKPTQDHQPLTKLTPESQTTQAPDNQIEAGTAHPDTSQSWSMPKGIQLHLRFKKLRDTWVPVVNVGIGFLALIVVAIQASIYNQQRKILNEQSEFMKAQTLAQTQIMAGRAYVGIAGLAANLTEGQVSIALNNFGNVPATVINLDATVYRATLSSAVVGGQSELKDAVTSKREWDAGAVPLFPGNFRMSVVIPLQDFSQEEVKAVLAKKRVLYVGGLIRYKDRNGNADSTPFAYEYNPPPNETWIANSDLSKFFNRTGQ